EKEWGVLVFPELRLKIRNGRYRVPDLVVLSKDTPRQPVVERAPLLCIEILSPEDRLPRILERCQDYCQLGVPETWIFDPETKRAYVYRHFSLMEEASDAVLKYDRIELALASLFAELEN